MNITIHGECRLKEKFEGLKEDKMLILYIVKNCVFHFQNELLSFSTWFSFSMR